MDSYDNQTNTTQTSLIDTTSAPISESATNPVPATSDSSSAPVSEPSVVASSDSVVVDPLAPVVPQEEDTQAEQVVSVVSEVASKIRDSKNILIALSADPSVDEMASAIGLSLFLDRLGKRATAIYSGATPNALEFLKPEETFETTADALQDFVIALDKEKADHLRYRLDGDYVKVFITPYKTRIAEEDLDFSYGDFNVDLVLALDVANGIDLDSALREHGRIMHDAVIINITTGKPGKFGEIEWSDTSASSVSEMVATLLYNFGGKIKIEKEEATAFLTGIVAATNRFSSAATRPDTMRLASRLMESGANQQLVAKNITPDVDNELVGLMGNRNNEVTNSDPTKLAIEHADEQGDDESKVVETDVMEKESSLLADLKAAEESLSRTGAEATLESRSDLFKIDDGEVASVKEDKEESAVENDAKGNDTEVRSEATGGGDEVGVGSGVSSENVANIESNDTVIPQHPQIDGAPVNSFDSSSGPDEHPEKVIAPSSDFVANNSSQDNSKYGQMLEDALSEPGGSFAQVVSGPIVSPAEDIVENNPTGSMNNPAMSNAPMVPTSPEINGVPEMNYMPVPGEEILPPPPAPPVGVNVVSPDQLPNNAGVSSANMNTPIMPEVLAQPVMTDQVYIPQASDPGAFKIPGM